MERIRKILVGFASGFLALGAVVVFDAAVNPADAVITEFDNGDVYIDIYFFEDGSILI